MMALMFIILLLAVLFAWWGKRKWAMGCFSILLIVASLVFYHHVTTHLVLQL